MVFLKQRLVCDPPLQVNKASLIGHQNKQKLQGEEPLSPPVFDKILKEKETKELFPQGFLVMIFQSLITYQHRSINPPARIIRQGMIGFKVNLLTLIYQAWLTDSFVPPWRFTRHGV